MDNTRTHTAQDKCELFTFQPLSLKPDGQYILPATITKANIIQKRSTTIFPTREIPSIATTRKNKNKRSILYFDTIDAALDERNQPPSNRRGMVMCKLWQTHT